MAKKIKVQAQAPVAEEAPAPTPVPVKAPPVKDTPEVKWARRLKRWSLKVEAEGVDPKKLMQELMAA